MLYAFRKGRPFSSTWFQALEFNRFSEPWRDDHGPKMPVLPWIQHPLEPSLIALFKSYGTLKTVPAGQSLYPQAHINALLYIDGGLCSRALPSLTGEEKRPAMAMGVPHRLVAGHLNWCTFRPCLGQYHALTPMRIYRLMHGEFENLLKTLPTELMWRFCRQVEMWRLSDRLGFALMTLASPQMRLETFLLAWGAYYGQLHRHANGTYQLRMCQPGRRCHVESVIGVSRHTLEKCISALIDKAHYKCEQECIELDAAYLQTAHDYLAQYDGDSSLYRRDASVIDFLEQIEKHAYH